MVYDTFRGSASPYRLLVRYRPVREAPPHLRRSLLSTHTAGLPMQLAHPNSYALSESSCNPAAELLLQLDYAIRVHIVLYVMWAFYSFI